MTTAAVSIPTATFTSGRFKISSLKSGERVQLRFTDVEHKESFEGEAFVNLVEPSVVVFDEITSEGKTCPTEARKNKWGEWISSGRLVTQVIGKAL